MNCIESTNEMIESGEFIVKEAVKGGCSDKDGNECFFFGIACQFDCAENKMVILA